MPLAQQPVTKQARNRQQLLGPKEATACRKPLPNPCPHHTTTSTCTSKQHYRLPAKRARTCTAHSSHIAQETLRTKSVVWCRARGPPQGIYRHVRLWRCCPPSHHSCRRCQQPVSTKGRHKQATAQARHTQGRDTPARGQTAACPHHHHPPSPPCTREDVESSFIRNNISLHQQQQQPPPPPTTTTPLCVLPSRRSTHSKRVTSRLGGGVKHQQVFTSSSLPP